VSGILGGEGSHAAGVSTGPRRATNHLFMRLARGAAMDKSVAEGAHIVETEN